ncbi:MAG: aspartate aminotransferase family protein [Bacillota bacterium]
MNELKNLFNEAQKYFVGGAGAGGRYHAVYGQPLYLKKASGSRLYDIEGKEYIDFHNSAGVALFGYNHPRLLKAIEKAVEMGFFLNFESEYHTELAKLICDTIPSAEKVRFANSGTEATLGAIRLARGYTGRDLVLRFEGHFHGMHELIWFNHSYISKIDQYGEVETLPDTMGIPGKMGELVKCVRFNDIDAVEHVAKKYKGQFAAMIMEPISYNCGCYPAKKEYLKEVREICDREGIVLIFDEVISGLRLRPGSAQAYYGVTPDITTLAKAIGGGFPIAAVVGKDEIMKKFNPTGKTVMSGTYTGSLMAVLASIECMKMAREDGFYDKIDQLAEALYGGLNDLFKKHGIPGHVRGMGARFGIFFGVDNPEDDFDWRIVASKFNSGLSKKFLYECLANGLYFHDYGNSPVPMHNGFSSQHTLKDIETALEKIDHIFVKIK